MSTQLLDRFTRLAPAAVVTGSPGAHRIDLFFTLPELGSLGRPNLWHRWWTEGGGWRPRNGWHQRGGSWVSAVSATAFSGGRVDLFGLGRSGSLFQATGLGDELNSAGDWPRARHGRPDGWTPWSSPAALATGPTSTIVALRALRLVDGKPQRALWFRQLRQTASNLISGTDPWSWRRRLSGTWPPSNSALRAAPALASRQSGALDIFGVTGSYQLRHSWIEADGDLSRWGGFPETGEGFLTSTPSVAVWRNSQNPAAGELNVACCYGPLGPLPGAISLKRWNGRSWGAQRLIYINGQTDGRGVAGPPVLVSWGKPRLDIFFVSQANIAGADIAITHGFSNDSGRTWDFRERLPLPDFS